MALATMQGVTVPNVQPPWVLTLSHTASLDSALPRDPLCAQFIKAGAAGGIHGLHLATAQQIFRWFRTAGPLVSVRTNVDVGYKHRTCVLEYWDEEDANYARLHCREFHFTLQRMEPFSLRTFAPHSVSGSNMGSKFTPASLPKTFEKFGDIIQQVLLVYHQAHILTTREAAASAVAELNDTVLNGTTIHVRYFEPGNQADFRLVQHSDVKKPPVPDQDPPLKPTQGAAEAKAQAKDDQSSQSGEDQERQAREEETKRQACEEETKRQAREEETKRQAREKETKRRQAETQARADYERKLQEATRQREVAAALEAAARTGTLESICAEDAAKAVYGEAVHARESATTELSAVSAAVLEAQRALGAARARQQDVLNRVSRASAAENEANKALREATARRVNAEMAEVRVQATREAADRKEKEVRDAAPPVDEAARRQEELEEMIQRMKELKEIEDRDRREKAERERREQEEAERMRQEAERLAREEQERKVREEQERKVREERKRKAREEQERLEREARRLQDYRDATLKEQERCSQRDRKWYRYGIAWTETRHVNWFKEVSSEFEEIKFSASQPLTFKSIPWPLLMPPNAHTLDLIEWSNVEAFFAAAKRIVGEKEYKTMVEKAHRRFHPDKWRSRGLSNTILDDDLREQLEKAGNVVAQAITPLWLASKEKKQT
ncbi:uncharacterized protein PHACADRAFT_214337 [Phanerochaete carnosa HHB-10118-sp]|uniref:RRM domain-containing protein n=1 Tax=Phanerochaete carnosa (strain HHB-10118-sp) TaxID=650164 RepID=K5VSU4_PHACS|nr:uncharacterized protein PHACADRAFT_214337 [Phanerochaete carnosa HHB-10118-sp]EKM49815.1 hypothetical protein PHACADRAFT_214337 [Phanerochaete carnosa HHB-10118-sp]